MGETTYSNPKRRWYQKHRQERNHHGTKIFAVILLVISTFWLLKSIGIQLSSTHWMPVTAIVVSVVLLVRDHNRNSKEG
jgi:hypothetical protein